MINFKGYGINGGYVTIMAARITHFYSVEYNGRSGTCIVLDTGKEITVAECESQVSLAIRQEMSKKVHSDG